MSLTVTRQRERLYGPLSTAGATNSGGFEHDPMSIALARARERQHGATAAGLRIGTADARTVHTAGRSVLEGGARHTAATGKSATSTTAPPGVLPGTVDCSRLDFAPAPGVPLCVELLQQRLGSRSAGRSALQPPQATVEEADRAARQIGSGQRQRAGGSRAGAPGGVAETLGSSSSLAAAAAQTARGGWMRRPPPEERKALPPWPWEVPEAGLPAPARAARAAAAAAAAAVAGSAGPASAPATLGVPPPQVESASRCGSRARPLSRSTDGTPKGGGGGGVGGRVARFACVASEPNSAFRAYMEDSAVTIDPFNVPGAGPGESWGLFAVYDGHGGRQAVDYCEAKLAEVLLDEFRACTGLPLSDQAVADALTRTFQRVDDQLRLVGAWRCGCTATVALVRRTGSAVRLYVANVGDSRAIAVDSSSCEWRVSRDHRPLDQAEARRVEADGGFVTRGRVAGQLAVSRALGDHALKGAGVSWRPHVSARDASRDVALIIASDGLWDVMTDADARRVLEVSAAHGSPTQAAQLLVREATLRGSMDNITCLVAHLDGGGA